MTIANASREEIYKQIFGVDIKTATKQEMNKVNCKLWRWKEHPAYEREWRKAWREAWGELTYKAIDVIREGMDDPNLPWRRTQSANLAVTYGQKNLIGDDDSAVKVEIVGMPDLGRPDEEES